MTTYQTAINTTANNVANTQTKGYSRQQVAIEAARSLRVNLRYGSVGSGVTASSIEQVRNMYYDLKYWNANAKLGDSATIGAGSVVTRDIPANSIAAGNPAKVIKMIE